MIKVTVWNENVQENGTKFMPPELLTSTDERAVGFRHFLESNVENIRKIHPNGIHNTLKEMLEEEEDIQVLVIQDSQDADDQENPDADADGPNDDGFLHPDLTA